MYEYFRGKITEVTPYYIVVEVGMIGYQVYVSNPFRYQVDEQSEVKVYIYQAVRENDITLYGFWDLNEKSIFVKLLNVSGIGPKSALAILANDDHQGLVTAIDNEDIGYLTKFPGVGKKTAKQIVLDLKGKMDVDATQTDLIGQQGLDLATHSGGANQYFEESIAALTALGYTKTEVKRISKKLVQFKGSSTDEYLREALRLLISK
ncbi:Holliday junction branch migration protein RuvA [Liquorilactobacillus capillatus]|uniref:Holliday junction branch migration complex subunit RuvA n=1 Tax=Liquorilactobacillus capillatus DSM 19910 TaxID=1423731 RepID=A0A0R1MH01_9LACO|nr:Holliday junction branch migration protein RuvA [Liquorilactobacillus capillatus]KRL03032.1 Holliday junction DNA helicase RuvA [Liquorilactobacillus capillatus DSM 19910]